MEHDFSRQIMEKCGTKYGHGNYILEHSKWKWELYFKTPKMEMRTTSSVSFYLQKLNFHACECIISTINKFNYR